jgi:ParB-like chromosome segregation protein Spo0J
MSAKRSTSTDDAHDDSGVAQASSRTPEALVAVVEGGDPPTLNIIERARAYEWLLKECGLTYRQVQERVKRTRSTVAAAVRLLKLSDEILGFLERGELRERHGRTLLLVKDLEVRAQLARQAVEEGWSAEALMDRALWKVHRQKQDRGETADSLARAWGEALRAEVGVRTLSYGAGFRVEVTFVSPTVALAAAERVGAALTWHEAQVAEGQT